MNTSALSYHPELEPAKIRQALLQLITPEELHCPQLVRRIARLAERFKVYSALYPFGLWAPGLALTNEMRALTDLYLPMTELRFALLRLLDLSRQHPALLTATPLHSATTWLDALRLLHPHVNSPDPASLLERLMREEDFRIRFLFHLCLPPRHGGEFRRYPGQLTFLRRWLQKRQQHGIDLRCLDAACGTGESTYELALLLADSKGEAGAFQVHGSTLEPLELFAAAHLFFPHDPHRQARYRHETAPLFRAGNHLKVTFFLEDLRRPAVVDPEPYDIILCNGLLGGPFVNSNEAMIDTVTTLTGRLRPGGILLATDRFHTGWKRRVPPSLLSEIFAHCSLHVRDIGDGLAGEK